MFGILRGLLEKLGFHHQCVLLAPKVALQAVSLLFVCIAFLSLVLIVCYCWQFEGPAPGVNPKVKI